ncbi:MAG: DUF1735 domain-containing protein [Bacteroidetes bacterium]|nr:DUF1735 domain-containing protein [Bacteroidota bacterium]MBS1541035.1 DUF1735 domain-containing protein [Bacteroidota bacterium]
MKKIKIISIFLMLAFVTVRCLKDNYINFSTVKPIVEFLDTQAQEGGFLWTMPAVNQSAPDSIFVRINVTGQYPPTSDIAVTVSVDQTTLNSYNTVNNSSYTMLPANAYNMPSATVTVKANNRVAFLPVLMNSSVIGTYANYALPLKITDASGQIISGNFNTIIVNPYVPTPNAYDGNYARTGTLTIGNQSPISISETQPLYSVNSSTSQTFASHFNNQSLAFQVIFNSDSSMSFIPTIGAKRAINNTPATSPNSYLTSSIVTIHGGKAKLTMNYFFVDSKNQWNTYKEVWQQQ